MVLFFLPVFLDRWIHRVSKEISKIMFSSNSIKNVCFESRSKQKCILYPFLYTNGHAAQWIKGTFWPQSYPEFCSKNKAHSVRFIFYKIQKQSKYNIISFSLPFFSYLHWINPLKEYFLITFLVLPAILYSLWILSFIVIIFWPNKSTKIFSK